MGAAVNIYSYPILENELMLNLASGVDETFQTMAHTNSIFEKAFTDKNWKAPAEYSVYLDFQTLPAKGQIRFHFTQNALVSLYNAMMGCTGVPDMVEVIDVLGEISNVCYGLAKGKLNREGYALGMALPHPGKTSDLPEFTSDRPNMVIPFRVFNEICYIQVVIL